MNDPKTRQSLENLANALRRLSEALQEPVENSLIVDGTIQRFEFVIELFWKTFMRLLVYEGIQVTTPREALSSAFQSRWIDDEAAWLQMLEDRNQTSHLYDEAAARRIYGHIKDYFPELARTHRFLAEQYLTSSESEKS
ncbi:MAG TPA: HI0074 family nucleotidyltransferase substrate-binding subunit [Sumerlaeia bacterium]|nr:HI0074 family nucleotidyltransferase substrate-binding subunit [Sumerlaeia bacterium]